MINTYNETSLHRVLKNIYSVQNEGRTEVKEGSFVFDIVTEQGDVIEIQTANISALCEKTEFVLSKGKKIKIVHPVIEKKWILTVSERGEKSSRKASPKTSTFFDSLRGFTKMCGFLKNENFSLELVYCAITEKREKTGGKVQNFTKTRRHLKDWIPAGKQLEKISRTVRLQGFDFVNFLVPKSIQENQDGWTVSELAEALFRAPEYSSLSLSTRRRIFSRANLIVWILLRAGFLEKCDEKKRGGKYRVVKE